MSESKRQPPRSGAEARAQGRVEEYAAATKQKLLDMDHTEETAEMARLQIIDRFKEEI